MKEYRWVAQREARKMTEVLTERAQEGFKVINSGADYDFWWALIEKDSPE